MFPFSQIVQFVSLKPLCSQFDQKLARFELKLFMVVIKSREEEGK
jgi:hypothetical protein